MATLEEQAAWLKALHAPVEPWDCDHSTDQSAWVKQYQEWYQVDGPYTWLDGSWSARLRAGTVPRSQ